MCSPVIGVVGSLMGGLVAAQGALQEADLQSAQYKAQSQAAKYEAQMNRDAGRYAAQRKADEGLRLRGDQIVAYANEGFALQGTPTDVIADTRSEIELDKLAIMTNSENRARVNDYEAKVASMNAKAAKQGGRIAATGAIIGGVTNAASFAMLNGGGSSGAARGGTVGSSFTPRGGVAPTIAPIPRAKPVGNIPVVGGYSSYGGPR